LDDIYLCTGIWFWIVFEINKVLTSFSLIVICPHSEFGHYDLTKIATLVMFFCCCKELKYIVHIRWYLYLYRNMVVDCL